MAKTLSENSRFNKFDLDNDGTVTDEEIAHAKDMLELELREEKADAQNDAAKLNLDAQNQQMRGAQFQQRLASQEKQTSARIQSAMERELLKQRGQ